MFIQFGCGRKLLAHHAGARTGEIEDFDVGERLHEKHIRMVGKVAQFSHRTHPSPTPGEGSSQSEQEGTEV